MNASKLALGFTAFAFAHVGAMQANAQVVNVDLAQHVSAFGAATVSAHKQGITVSNVNQLDADGIALDVFGASGGRGATGWQIAFGGAGLTLAEGSSINPVVFGTRDGQWTTSPAAIQMVNGQLNLSATVYHDTPIAVDILDRNGAVVHTIENLAPGDLPVTVGPPRTLVIIVIIDFIAQPPSGENICSWVFDFSGPEGQSVPFIDTQTGEILAEGTTLVAREMTPRGVTVVMNASISGQNLQPFDIDGMTMTLAPTCLADFNHDGVANSQDFFDFLGSFFANEPAADINTDGAINSQDLFDFLGAFFTGC